MTSFKSSLSLILLVTLIFFLSSCGQLDKATKSTPVPSAESSNLALPEFQNDLASGESSRQAWKSDFGSEALTTQALGSANAHNEGAWSAIFDWPFIGIHVALLPNGKVFSFGTAPKSQFRYLELEAFHHDVWDPAKGFGAGAHTTLANASSTNIFCGGVSLLPDGRLMIVGGDLPYERNLDQNAFKGNPDLNLYNYQSGQLTRSPLQMTRGRWYPTVVNLANGEVAVIGGYDARQKPTTEVEVWNPKTGWRIVSGLGEFRTYLEQNWSYPFVFSAPNGELFFAQPRFAYLNTDSNSMRFAGGRNSAVGMGFGSAVMYDEGKILVLGGGNDDIAFAGAETIDISNDTPIWKTTNAMSVARKFPDATLLADGQVFVNGGSNRGVNAMNTIVYPGEIWNPRTESWTQTARAGRSRMYHSTAVLLPDASVLTIGGDRPEAAANFNGEIFYPPYLFKKDGSGELAPRPVISSVQDFTYKESFSLSFSNATSISKVSFLKAGTTTHSWNNSQRFLNLEFSQTGSSLEVKAPERVEIAPPGHYLLFIFDEHGVPSEARIVELRNKAPTIRNPGRQSSDYQDSIALTIQASDPLDEQLSYSAQGLPAGLSLDASNGRISGVISSVGTFKVSITVRNQSGFATTLSFDWVISADSVPPIELEPLFTQAQTVGSTIQYSLNFKGGLNPRFRWSFANEAYSEYSSSSSFSHSFSKPGHHPIKVLATDDTGKEVSLEAVQFIHEPLTSGKPVASSTILFDADNERVWTVNPDNNSVTVIDAKSNSKIQEIPVGNGPRAVTLVKQEIWVSNKFDASISIINKDSLVPVRKLSLPYASQPYGLVADSKGEFVYVVLEARGEVLKFDSAGNMQASLAVGPNPRHISISADGKLLLPRYISPVAASEASANNDLAGGAEVLLVSAASLSLEQSLTLRQVYDPLATISGSGIANYLAAAAISPDGKQAWIPSKHDDITRGSLRDGQNLNFEHTVRSIASPIMLTDFSADVSQRIDFDNGGIANAAVFSHYGDYLFVALEGSREIAVIDTYSHLELFRFATGLAPQGLALSADGLSLYVDNFLDRSVTVYDLSSLVTTTSQRKESVRQLSSIKTVEKDLLSSEVLRGKQLFYDAADDRLAKDNYISCAACHNDGGHDGRVWDFSGFGEGLRNTISLRGRAGTAHGRLHWTGNFDEVQDFEGQIRNLANGTGLLSDSLFHAGSRAEALGDAKAGLSADLDALAAYVASLDSFAPSPYRNNDGSLTNEAKLGKRIFQTAGCIACHGGDSFSDSPSQVLHDIGTIKASSGKRLNQELSGIDSPTLRDVWATAPYLHDGSAATLHEAVKAHRMLHLSDSSINTLVSYLLQIDGSEAAPEPLSESASIVAIALGNHPERSPGKGKADVIALRFSTIVNQVTDLTSIRLSSSGTGNDAFDLKAIKLYLDRNQDGLIDSGDSQLALGSFSENNGYLNLNLTSKLELAAGEEMQFIVSVDISNSLASSLYGSTYALLLLGMLGMLARKRLALILLIVAASLLSACSTTPKPPIDNIQANSLNYQLSLEGITGLSEAKEAVVTGLPIQGSLIKVKK